MAASVPWACCAVLAAAAAAVYTQKHSPQGECLGELLASSSRTVHESLLAPPHMDAPQNHTGARLHGRTRVAQRTCRHGLVISWCLMGTAPHSHTWIVTC